MKDHFYLSKMIESKEIQISLDKGTNYNYTPGEDISGEVTLHLKEPKTYTDFFITCKGRAKTRFRTLASYYGSNSDPSYFVIGKEQIFKVERTLSTPDDGDLGTFISGSHHFRFTFTLPSGIPSRVCLRSDDYYANITYKIVVSLKAPAFQIDIKDRCWFSVRGLLDLNSFPWLRQPHEIYKVEPVSGGCCFSGNAGEIEYKLMLKKSAFVWGEVIPFTVEIKNQSTKDIPKWSVKLVESIIFKYDGQHIRPTKSLIAKKKGGPIVKGGSDGTSEDLVMEERPYSSNFGGSISIIKLTYQLLFKIGQPWGHPIRERIPILIGDIPFHDGNKNYK